jgi:acyl-CoA thioester hydrolase
MLKMRFASIIRASPAALPQDARVQFGAQPKPVPTLAALETDAPESVIFGQFADRHLEHPGCLVKSQIALSLPRNFALNTLFALDIWPPRLKIYAAMEPVFKHEHRVTYAECTIGNHVYYARYLDILEAARGEFFRRSGIPLLLLQEADTAFPVIELNIAYNGPARYDDVLTIELWISEMKGIRLSFGFTILNPSGDRLVEGETRHVCAGLGEKPKRIPNELLERFQPFVRAQTDAA